MHSQIDGEIIPFTKLKFKLKSHTYFYAMGSFARKDVNNFAIAILIQLGETSVSVDDHRCSLPSHSSIPGFLPSKWFWRIKSSLCKRRCSVGNPKELADIFPLCADPYCLGFADQIPMGWNVHRWGQI